MFALKFSSPGFRISAITNTTTISLADMYNNLMVNMIISIIAIGTEYTSFIKSTGSQEDVRTNNEKEGKLVELSEIKNLQAHVGWFTLCKFSKAGPARMRRIVFFVIVHDPCLLLIRRERRRFAFKINTDIRKECLYIFAIHRGCVEQCPTNIFANSAIEPVVKFLSTFHQVSSQIRNRIRRHYYLKTIIEWL